MKTNQNQVQNLLVLQNKILFFKDNCLSSQSQLSGCAKVQVQVSSWFKYNADVHFRPILDDVRTDSSI